MKHHPIEVFIAMLLVMIEGIAWIINELAGFHNSQHAPAPVTYAESHDIIDMTWEEAMNHKVAIRPHVQPVSAFSDYTVKALRELTGITNSRYRKDDLLRIITLTV